MIKPKIIDTHTHLCDPVFDNDRARVIQRAREAGVEAIVLVSENIWDARRNCDLAAKYPILFPAVGL